MGPFKYPYYAPETGGYFLLLYHDEVNARTGIGLERSHAHFRNLLLLSVWGILTTAGCLLTEMTQTSQ